MEYIVIKSNRKTMSLSVNDDLIPVVRAPYFVSEKQIDAFVNSNSNWIENAVQRKRNELDRYHLSDEELCHLIEQAKAYIPSRVDYFSELMQLEPTGIKITKAKKRFGSCSGRNSLCFSCYLMLYPKSAIDYVVVHELAHIKHHNHSKAFYNLIEQYLPDYKERIKQLKA